MPRHPAATNLVGVNTLESSGATTAHLFTTGTSLGVGAGCLLSGTSTSPSNTAFGHQALAALPTASAGFNTAVGYTALQTAAAAATKCTAVGYQALKVGTSTDNTAVGYNAGKAVTTGIGNTMVGSGAGGLMTTATGNTFIGFDAAAQATTAIQTVCVGYRAGYTVTNGGANTFLGYSADGTASATSSATVVGQAAKAHNNSVALGNGAVCTAQYAVACGYNAAAAGGDGVAIGDTSVASANYTLALGSKASATANGAVALGCDSGSIGASTAVLNEFKFGTANHRYNFPGQLNTAFNAGTQKITNLATPTVGTDAATMAYVDSKAGGGVVGTANRITVASGVVDISPAYVGQSSITTVGTVTAGTWTGTPVAIANGGTGATDAATARANLGLTGTGLAGVTTIDNTFVGVSAGAVNTGASNTFLGYNAGHSVSSSSNNVFIGMNAGGSITTATGNTLIGVNAGRFLVSGVANSDNTLVGYNMGGNYTYENTYLGSGTGVSGNGSDYANTFIGKGAGGPMTGASRSVCVGRNASIAAGTFALCTAVGADAGANNASATAIGGGALANGNTSLAIGPSTTASASYSGAIGANAIASAAGAWALATDGAGAGATTSVANEIKLGTALHTVNIPGALTVAGSPVGGGGGVPASTWTANSIVKADAAATPIALTVGASTIVGRASTGSIAALTAAQTKAVLAVTPADVSGFDTQVRTSRLDQMALPGATVNINSQVVSNVGTLSIAGALTDGHINLPLNGAIRAYTGGGTVNVIRSTATGASIGGNVGFFNAAPVNQDIGWTVGSYTPFRAGISSGLTVTDCANAIATLITVLKGYGLLG